jgi:K+ transporter
LVWGATRVVRPPATDSPVPLTVTAVVMGVLALTIMYGWGDVDAKLWRVAGILLLVVYVAAAQANSRLDDSSTTAWAVFALMGLVVAVTAFLTGADAGWWPVAIAAVIIVAAAAWAARSERVSRENRTA